MVNNSTEIVYRYISDVSDPIENRQAMLNQLTLKVIPIGSFHFNIFFFSVFHIFVYIITYNSC